ncbi:UNVERIFIED_CONTAM: hypothetical protein Slati_1354700 [Sesamum latifolium]|uniref:Uncharacterized protein n=1 Tax=Sesamum latifolium TaxID=2727402 RepID=A0AAW2XM26_9LAMI
MLMYLDARARRTSNLVAGFLASNLKKSPSISPCAKALALTSWVAEGTSKAAVLNLSSRAAFSNRDRCSCGSVVPSYSAIAAVRQFTGNSSAMTSSMKGMPGCSSAGAPITWCWTSCSPFWRDSSRANHWGGTFPAWAGGCWAGPRTTSGLGITKVGSACSGTTTACCIVTWAGARTVSCSRMADVTSAEEFPGESGTTP